MSLKLEDAGVIRQHTVTGIEAIEEQRPIALSRSAQNMPYNSNNAISESSSFLQNVALQEKEQFF